MASEYSQSIADRVTKRLAATDQTQTQLAAALGVTQTTISRRCAGKNDWPIGDLPLVAGFFGITLAELTDPASAAA